MTRLRRREWLLLALLVALVAWMAFEAADRAGAARSEAARRALTDAERIIVDVLAEPVGQWPGEVAVAMTAERPPRHPFDGAEHYAEALEAALRERAWEGAVAATVPASVMASGGETWLVQRIGDTARARPWGEIAARITTRTGGVVDSGPEPSGVLLLAGVLEGEGGMVALRSPPAGRILSPWFDVARALLAALAAGLLVFEVQRARSDRAREQARAEVRDAVLQRISHELRTPAASVRSLSDALSAGAVEDPEERRQFLALIAAEAERLALGIDRLTKAARGDGGEPLQVVPLDLADWARSLAERWRARLPDLRLEVPDGLPWRADPDRLDEAVEALLDNACKYGGPDVRLRVARVGDRVAVSVQDDGPGVPATDRGRVLDRLQRVEGRPGDPGGYGLGLWAAAEVARAHGGALTLEGGARFVITLGEPR